MTQIIDQTPPTAWQAPPPPPPGPTKRPWYRNKWVWGGAVLAVLVIGAAGSSSDKKIAEQNAAAQTPVEAAPSTVTSAAPTTVPAAAATPSTQPKATTTTTEAVSSCEQVREALLTGTQAEINAAMARLQADKTADSTAREYADYYLHRDAPPAMGSKDLREMDVSLIRMSCG